MDYIKLEGDPDSDKIQLSFERQTLLKDVTKILMDTLFETIMFEDALKNCRTKVRYVEKLRLDNPGAPSNSIAFPTLQSVLEFRSRERNTFLGAGICVNTYMTEEEAKDSLEPKFGDVTLLMPDKEGRGNNGFLLLFVGVPEQSAVVTPQWYATYVDANGDDDDPILPEVVQNALDALARTARIDQMATVSLIPPVFNTALGTTRDFSSERPEIYNTFKRILELSETDMNLEAPARFTAYFNYLPETMRAEEYMKGKLTSEAAAHNILDTAAVRAMDSKEAVLLLQQYIQQNGLSSGQATSSANGDSGAQQAADFAGLIEQIQQSNDATSTAKLFREAILARKSVPTRNVLGVKDEQAGDKTSNPAFNIDAQTAEFERDIAAARNTKESAMEQLLSLYSTVFSCMFGTTPMKKKLANSITTTFGQLTPGDEEFLAYGAILYSGQDENILSLPEGETGSSNIAAVKKIFDYGRIPVISRFSSSSTTCGFKESNKKRKAARLTLQRSRALNARER